MFLISELFSLTGFSDDGVKRLLRFINPTVKHLPLRNWLELYTNILLSPASFISAIVTSEKDKNESFNVDLDPTRYENHPTEKVKGFYLNSEEKFQQWTVEHLEESKQCEGN